MAIAAFQRALADLIASPQRCLEARKAGRVAFAEYALTEREITRLERMVMDAGMSINCTLYRVNRLTPVYSVLPLTCRMLGDSIAHELDAFWAVSRDATLQYRWEAWRFGTWLLERISRGDIPGGSLEDVIHFELACFEVRTAPRGDFPEDAWRHPRKRILRLHHDISTWLAGETTSQPVTRSGTPSAVLLDASGTDLQVSLIAE